VSEAPSPPPVKSATRTLDIIEYVVSRDRPLAAQEIATALAIPMSSLSYLLGTLLDRAYLAREGRRYVAGPGLHRLQARRTSVSLAEQMEPLVRALRVQLNETSCFFVWRGWDIVALAVDSSEQALRYSAQVGQVVPAHSFSAGKALLAALPEPELDRYFRETNRQAFTPATLISEEDLRRDLLTIRKEGIAYSRQEHITGICGIGRAAVVEGTVIGAFSVAIPSARLDAELERRARELLIRTSELLSSK